MALYSGAGLQFDKPKELSVEQQQSGQAIILRLRQSELRMEMNIVTGSVFDVAEIATDTRVQLHMPQGKKKTGKDVRIVAHMLLSAFEADATLQVHRDPQNKKRGEGTTAQGLRYEDLVYITGSGSDVIEGMTIVFAGKGPRIALIGYRGNISCTDVAQSWCQHIRDSLQFQQAPTIAPLKGPRYKVNRYVVSDRGSYFETDTSYRWDVTDARTSRVIASFDESCYDSAGGSQESGVSNVQISPDNQYVIATHHGGKVEKLEIALLEKKRRTMVADLT